MGTHAGSVGMFCSARVLRIVSVLLAEKGPKRSKNSVFHTAPRVRWATWWAGTFTHPPNICELECHVTESPESREDFFIM
jgi:hypothetical protein